MPADRERVARWAQQPALGVPLSIASGVRLVADIQAERRRGALLRAFRDAGLVVAVALVGAVIAVRVQPPVTRGLAGFAVAWLVVLVILAWLAVRRAKGRGVLGSAEANARYHADPESFAFGGLGSLGIGTGLGAGAMLAALAARLW